MKVDRSGRMVTSKEFIRSLVIASIDDVVGRYRVEIDRQARDASGRNWSATITPVQEAAPDDMRKMQNVVRSLMAAYNLPSERADG